MAASTQFATILFALFLFQYLSGSYSTIFTIVIKCSYTIWPAILSSAGISLLSSTGFALQHDESRTVFVPPSWSGRLWGRTFCSKEFTGKFSCVTGDCGSSTVDCAGGNTAPPATVAEFSLNSSGGLDFFDVSLVDGYNLPMMVVPQGGTGNCTGTGCVVDLNAACPVELKVMSGGGGGGGGVACKSACGAFGDPQYCCSGAYATPETCKPSSYSLFFKSACPRAYSYASDGGTSTFTCASADYLVTFCPSPNTSSIYPVKRKDPKAVDNTGVQALIKIVTVVVGVIVTSICGFLVCRIRFYFANRNWGIELVAGIRSETSGLNPQPVSSTALPN